MRKWVHFSYKQRMKTRFMDSKEKEFFVPIPIRSGWSMSNTDLLCGEVGFIEDFNLDLVLGDLNKRLLGELQER